MKITSILSRFIGFFLYLPCAVLQILGYAFADGIIYWNDRFNGKAEHKCPRCEGKGYFMQHKEL